MDSINNGDVIYSTGTSGFRCIQQADNKVAMSIEEKTPVQWQTRTSDALQANTWYHFCQKVTSNDMQFYINGTEVTNALDPGGYGGDIDYTSVSYINVGRSGAGTDYAGYIDEFAIWDSALSDSEISRLALSFKKRLPLLIQRSNLQVYYSFDEYNVGTTYTWNVFIVRDLSGYSRNSFSVVGTPKVQAGILGYLSNPMVGGGGQ